MMADVALEKEPERGAEGWEKREIGGAYVCNCGTGESFEGV